MCEAHRAGVELSTAKSANGAAQCFGAGAGGVAVAVGAAIAGVRVHGVEKVREGGEEVVLGREERDLRAPERGECVARADPGRGGDLDAAVCRRVLGKERVSTVCEGAGGGRSPWCAAARWGGRGVLGPCHRRGIGSEIGSEREVVGEEDVEARVEADGGARGGGPLAEGDEAVTRRGGEVVAGEEGGEGERVRPGVDRAARRRSLGGRRGIRVRFRVRFRFRVRVCVCVCGLGEEDAGFLECLAEGGHAKVGILAGIEVATGKGLELARSR